MQTAPANYSFMKAPESNPLAQAPVLQGFPPVINEHTHTLILGSFPGAASLTATQYYAYRQNQFWRLVSASLATDLVTLDYEQRQQTLLAHGIGLWDVFHSCVRAGSLDSAIREGKLNDFSGLRATHPHLRKLCFNGQTAGKMATYFQQHGYQTLILPSSSPAHATRSFADKLLDWQAGLQPAPG